MIRFTGVKFDKSEMKLLKEVAQFTLDKFIPRSKQKNIHVTINLTESPGWSGECEYVGNEDGVRKFKTMVSTKRVNTRAKKLLVKLKDPIKTIIHEMVHVKQYATNQMFDYINGDTKFEGKLYKNTRNYLEYWDHPWEQEAYGRTDGIYEQFLFCRKHGLSLKEAKRKIGKINIKDLN